MIDWNQLFHLLFAFQKYNLTDFIFIPNRESSHSRVSTQRCLSLYFEREPPRLPARAPRVDRAAVGFQAGRAPGRAGRGGEGGFSKVQLMRCGGRRKRKRGGGSAVSGSERRDHGGFVSEEGRRGSVEAISSAFARRVASPAAPR